MVLKPAMEKALVKPAMYGLLRKDVRGQSRQALYQAHTNIPPSKDINLNYSFMIKMKLIINTKFALQNMVQHRVFVTGT